MNIDFNIYEYNRNGHNKIQGLNESDIVMIASVNPRTLVCSVRLVIPLCKKTGKLRTKKVIPNVPKECLSRRTIEQIAAKYEERKGNIET